MFPKMPQMNFKETYGKEKKRPRKCCIVIFEILQTVLSCAMRAWTWAICNGVWNMYKFLVSFFGYVERLCLIYNFLRLDFDTLGRGSRTFLADDPYTCLNKFRDHQENLQPSICKNILLKLKFWHSCCEIKSKCFIQKLATLFCQFRKGRDP